MVWKHGQISSCFFPMQEGENMVKYIKKVM
jgi:hypothetical protein